MDTYKLTLDCADKDGLEFGQVFVDAGPVTVTWLGHADGQPVPRVSVEGTLARVLDWTIDTYCGGDIAAAMDLVRLDNPDLVKITPEVGGVEQVPEWAIKVKYVDASGNKQVHKASFLAWSWHDAKQQAAEIVDAVQADYGSVKGATLKITD